MSWSNPFGTSLTLGYTAYLTVKVTPTPRGGILRLQITLERRLKVPRSMSLIRRWHRLPAVTEIGQTTYPSGKGRSICPAFSFFCNVLYCAWLYIFSSSLYHWKTIIWAASWQNQQCGCAPRKDSDQPGHPSSLIRVFAVRSMGS